MVKKSENHSKKKSERKKVRKSCTANIFAGKKVMTFFPMLLILVTGRFHFQKSREIKSEFSDFFPLTFYPLTFYSLTFLPETLFPCTLLAATL